MEFGQKNGHYPRQQKKNLRRFPPHLHIPGPPAGYCERVCTDCVARYRYVIVLGVLFIQVLYLLSNVMGGLH